MTEMDSQPSAEIFIGFHPHAKIILAKFWRQQFLIGIVFYVAVSCTCGLTEVQEKSRHNKTSEDNTELL